MGYGFGPSTDTKPTHDKPGKPIMNQPGSITCPYCGRRLTLKGNVPVSPGFGPWFGPGGHKQK
ncbi:MAG: hypothetical protein JL50_12730 [Peptococcaceae bacterium BICA1-7]|nr:MAG: hypothetical protein JL50_12730 [Peptococcaceae bacterium BICA1-7]HBV97264.1 hypothetical protein [Desulfotomaculum sp.]